MMSKKHDLDPAGNSSPFDASISRRDAMKIAGVGAAAAAFGLAGSSPLAEAVEAAGHSREFHSAWPYVAPPQGHFNTFASDGNAIFLDSAGYFLDFIEMPMAIYHWATGTYIPWMATDWKLTPTTFTVHLRKTSNLSDGSVFTSRDVLTTFNVKRLLSDQVWSYIDKVTAPDAHTVVFHMSTPATVVQYLVLRMNIRADSTYSHFGTQVQQLVNAGKTMDSPEAKALRLELNQYRPAAMVACGPFKFDPNSQITSGQITLVKNIGCWAANQVQFDKIVDYNGETAAITPLILAKQIDYATQAFPPDTERAITSKGIGIVRPPLGSGPAIYINFKKVPDLVSTQARQALAYAINRDQAATVSLGLSAKSCKYMAGISDSLAGGWVDAADLAKLNNYALDVAKAASMLTTLGFKKGSDGVYVGPSGAKMDLTLEVPAEYTDWSATAQNVAEQLTAFGFKITVKPVTYTQEPIDIDKGNVQLAIGPWGAGSPFPRYSFYNDIELHNPPVALGPGTGLFDLKLGVDFKSLINASGAGLDTNAQKKAVATAAVAFNSLLPVIPMWERYGNNVALSGVRVTGWPPIGDPIYKNSPYGDSFVTLMVVNGTLKGV